MQEQLFVGQGQGTSAASGHMATAGANDQMDIDHILMLAARQHSQTAGSRPVTQLPVAGQGLSSGPIDVTGHGAYQHPRPNAAVLPSQAVDSPHWGWTSDRPSGKGPEYSQEQHGGQGQWKGPGDSGVAALLASLKGQVVGAQQQQGLDSQAALPSWVVEAQHRHGNAQEGL